jgi:hypothetical protein
MDMLDVYVDDYTQFEPLPAAMRMRLPSARDFLSDSERAAVEAVEAPTGAPGDAPGSSVEAGSGSSAEASGLATDEASVDANSGLSAAGSAAPVASADDPARSLDVSSSPAAQSGKSTASDPSSS